MNEPVGEQICLAEDRQNSWDMFLLIMAFLLLLLLFTLVSQLRMVALLKDIYNLHGFSVMLKESKVMALSNCKPQFQVYTSKSRVVITVENGMTVSSPNL